MNYIRIPDAFSHQALVSKTTSSVGMPGWGDRSQSLRIERAFIGQRINSFQLQHQTVSHAHRNIRPLPCVWVQAFYVREAMLSKGLLHSI